MHTFYETTRCRDYITDWFSAAFRTGLRLDASIAGSLDTFYRHVGRRPFGQWTLFARSKTKVVWIPMTVYRAMSREEINNYIDENEHLLPYHPWTQGTNTALAASSGAAYVRRYFASKPSNFDSADALLNAVGPRPGLEWMLTTNIYPTRRRKSESPVILSEANFLWITEDAVKAAKQGKLQPPVFPPEANRTETDQIINDTRFAAYVSGVIKYAQDLRANKAWTEEKEQQLQALILKMEEFVVSKGYQPHDALNPRILPDHQKLQKGRELAQRLMDDITRGRRGTRDRDTIRRLNATNKAQRQAEQETEQTIKKANQVPNPSGRGRPLKRFVKRKVKIADLTAAQREQLGLPEGQDFIRIRTENTGRWARRSWVELEVLNPVVRAMEERPAVPVMHYEPDYTAGGFA